MKEINLEFTGYEPKPVLAQKMDEVVAVIKELQLEVAKLKLAAEPAKKAVKTAKVEE
jgi:hypothetical protein